MDLRRRTELVAVEGGSIVVSIEGHGPPVLLLHGGPGLTDYLDSLSAELAPIGTVARYQQRGLAPSPISGDRSVDGHVADAVAVMDGLGWDRAVVVGHSWGAHLALHTAVAHPERLLGVVAIDGLGAVPDGGVAALGENLLQRLTPEERARMEALDALDPSDAETAETAIASLRILWPHYFGDPAAAPAMPAMDMDVEGHRQTWASVNAHFEAGTLVNGLPTVLAPAVVMHGGASPIPPSTAEATAALIPNCRLRILPGVGHWAWLEDPGSVRTEVAALLG